MEQIHLVSVYVFVAFLYLVGPIVTWLILWGARSRGVNLWCGGGLLLSLGILLAAGKDVDPSPWLMGASNVLLFASIVVRIQALLDFVGKKLRLGMWTILGFIFTLAYEYLLLNGTDPLVYVLVIQILMLGRTVHVSFLISRQPHSKSVIWTGYTYLIMALAMVAMLIGISSGNIPADYLATNPFTVALLLTGALSSLTGNLGIIGLILERTRAKEAEALVARARAESSLALGGQIAQLQRRHVVGEMSGIISHELSQPLSAALWSVQTAERQVEKSHPNDQDIVSNLHRSVLAIRKTIEMLDQIRSFVRPNRAEQDNCFDYADMVSEVVEITQALAQRKSVTIRYNPPTKRVQICGDKVQLSQVLLNLLVNAIDAAALTTKEHGEVNVEVRQTDNALMLIVSDNGPGFTETDLTKIGEPFYTSKPDGLGLGLSIAKSIVAQHGGALRWHNGSLGGACINMYLPVTA